MDPYGADGELINIHSAFHQGQYASVLSFDTSTFSPENNVPVKTLQYRAHLALGQYVEVLAALKKEKGSEPDFAALKILAEYSINPEKGEASVEAAQKLAAEKGDNLTVQIAAGSVLAQAGLVEEALSLLSKHQGSLDAVALITQIHLLQNRTDLARAETLKARKWAQDSLLVNLAESWVGLREGGEAYQSAYYVFEELAQAPASTSITSLLGQAVAELHLGRLPEAEAAFGQAVALDAGNSDLLANSVVLNTILGKGKEAEEAWGKLEKGKVQHQLVRDVHERREVFAAASAKYTPKFEP